MPFFKRTRHFSKLSIMITSLTITLEDHENILAWMNRMSYLRMVLFVPYQMGFDLVKIRVPQFRICNLRKIVMIILKNAHPWRYYSLLTHGGIILWNTHPWRYYSLERISRWGKLKSSLGRSFHDETFVDEKFFPRPPGHFGARVSCHWITTI